MKAPSPHGNNASAPGLGLLSPTALGATTLLVVNDLWLKPAHPGVWSGKLSDVALCILLPLFVLALLEWAAWFARRPMPGVHMVAAFAIGLGYFCAVKSWPSVTQAHVALMRFVLLGRHVGAVTDPTDLLCLPFAWFAWNAAKPPRGMTTALVGAAPTTTSTTSPHVRR